MLLPKGGAPIRETQLLAFHVGSIRLMVLRRAWAVIDFGTTLPQIPIPFSEEIRLRGPMRNLAKLREWSSLCGDTFPHVGRVRCWIRFRWIESTRQGGATRGMVRARLCEDEDMITAVIRRTLIVLTLTLVVLALGTATGCAAPPASSGPIVINGQNGVVISGAKITSATSDCVQIINSTNITIQASDIGPCGTDNTSSPSNGIHISGGSGINIYDNYIHPETLASDCCDSHDGILIENGTSAVTIQGNVIAYGEANLKVASASNVTITGNFLLNPRNSPNHIRGQIQVGGGTNFLVQNNYMLSSTVTTKYLYPGDVEDSLNFIQANTFTAKNNYISGYSSTIARGCGIQIDYQSNWGQILSNVLVETGACLISVSDGVGHIVDSNKGLNATALPQWLNSAVGLQIWEVYPPNTCGGSGPPNWVTVSNNIAAQKNSDGTWLTFKDYQACGTINLVNNVFDKAAYDILYLMATTNPPPLIPPQPYSCVASSPYSTQTSAPLCTSTSTTPPSIIKKLGTTN
jgi:hypothetical protein